MYFRRILDAAERIVAAARSMTPPSCSCAFLRSEPAVHHLAGAAPTSTLSEPATVATASRKRSRSG
jgi:hypothetical protein